eukprot:5392342-Prymnesium_polylepis.1
MRSAVICVALLAALSADAFVVPARTIVPAPAARAVSPTVNGIAPSLLVPRCHQLTRVSSPPTAAVPCRINEPNMVIF